MPLLPEPKSLIRREGTFAFREGMRILLPPGLERPEWLACKKLHDAIVGRSMARPQFDRMGLLDEQFPGSIHLRIEKNAAHDARQRQGYRLAVRADGIDIVGRSSAGLLNGLRTLVQLVDEHGGTGIPCLEIEDEPDFAWRGFYYDISRGKVPKLDTYKVIVRELAALKANMFQLYVEHPFAFRFDPEISRGDALTPEEVLELQDFCRDRRIELVPSLQCFGHMGGTLSLPRYRHLAEIPMEGSWSEMPWPKRLRGATIDTSSADGRALIERMFDAHVSLFDSPFANVCADETYDLGKGKGTAALVEKMGTGRLYLDHIGFLRGLCEKHGKQMMFWGDIIKHYPDLVPEIPRDAILLNWGYDAETDYESCALFEKAGLEFFGCPGTSGWGRVLNALDNADLNIRRYAAASRKHGATGLLNTDWGDHGHYNLLAGSAHGIALGAAMAWNCDAPDRAEFDARWNVRAFHDPDSKGVQALRRLSFVADKQMTWVQMYSPFTLREKYANLTPEVCQKLIAAAQEAYEVFETYRDREHGEVEFVLELLHGVRMSELLGEKGLLVHDLARPEEVDRRALAERLRHFARRLERAMPEYERLWLARNKRSDLDKILAAARGVVREARELAASAVSDV